MLKFLEVIVLVVLPLAWGLLINSFFELLRRRGARANGPEGGAA